MLKLVSPCCCRTNLNSMFSRLIRCRLKTHKQRSTFQCLSILNWLNVFNRTLRDMKCWFCRLSSAIVMTDCNMRLLPLALWSVNPCFELPTVFIIKYLINPSMEYLIAIWWPCVQNCAKTHCSCHCKTVSNSVCLSEGATVTKGGGAYR